MYFIPFLLPCIVSSNSYRFFKKKLLDRLNVTSIRILSLTLTIYIVGVAITGFNRNISSISEKKFMRLDVIFPPLNLMSHVM